MCQRPMLTGNTSVKMVVKKRCDFCLKIKPDNLQAEQKVLNKEIKDVLIQISGIEISAEQLSNILTCYDCAISLIQAEPIAVKVRALLTRLLKQKNKKKSSTTNGGASASASVQEKSNLNEDNDEAQEAIMNDSVKKAPAPKKIAIRRKSVAKKLVDSLVNDELEGSPVASSTMAVNANAFEDNSTPKNIKKKQRKQSVTANGDEATPSLLNSAKRKISEKSESNSQEQHTLSNKTPKKDEYGNVTASPKKSAKLKIPEKSDHSFQEGKKLKTPKKNEPVSPTKSAKRTISERSDSQGESNEPVKQFKKFKDPNEEKLSESQDSANGEGVVKECLECGKIFRHMDRYEAHVIGQKCKLAAHACKHPDCMRRFFKLHKMLEHMQRKHPEMQATETD